MTFMHVVYSDHLLCKRVKESQEAKWLAYLKTKSLHVYIRKGFPIVLDKCFRDLSVLESECSGHTWLVWAKFYWCDDRFQTSFGSWVVASKVLWCCFGRHFIWRDNFRYDSL